MAQENFQNNYDYIIVGGGLAGCVLGARLREKMHNSSVLIIEAGPDCVGHPLTSEPLACFGARKCNYPPEYVPSSNEPLPHPLGCPKILGHWSVGWMPLAQILPKSHLD